jgi:hypothetical protein
MSLPLIAMIISGLVVIVFIVLQRMRAYDFKQRDEVHNEALTTLAETKGEYRAADCYLNILSTNDLLLRDRLPDLTSGWEPCSRHWKHWSLLFCKASATSRQDCGGFEPSTADCSPICAATTKPCGP